MGDPLDDDLGSDSLHDVLGNWALSVAGDGTLSARGGCLYVSARGKSTDLYLDATGVVSIAAGIAQIAMTTSEEVMGKVEVASGPEGTISMLSGLPELGSHIEVASEWTSIQVGVPDLGANVKLTPESIELTVGAPGEGSSISMTPESITFKVGEVTVTITPEGVTEEVLSTTREATPEGHNLTAAETEFNVGVEGVASEGPTKLEETEGGTVENETLGADSTDALKNEDAAVKITE